MGTLYECLREARLEKFYPAFRANGITRSEALINLGMPEFSALGITGTEDKRRLTELVNIIKSVHNSGLSNSPMVSRRTSRNQSASSFAQLETSNNNSQPGRITSHGRNMSERVPNFSAASYADMLEYLTESSESESPDEDSEDEAESEHMNVHQAPSPSSVRASIARGPVERIQHSKTKGYNYGVHKVPTTPKQRSGRASTNSQRNLTGDERIRVCVRKRGLSRREMRAKDEDIVSVESTNTLTINEPKLAVDLKAYTLQHEFVFDEVFDEACSNQDVYLRAARPLISCVFNGGTATCFAYGQTGAGKTYTMLGNTDIPGLYLLAGEDIFSIIQSGEYGRDLHVWVSYFEIYCGQLFDLLNRRNRLYAREDGNKQVCISGLTETEATSVQSLLQIMDYGNSVRSKGATGVNPDSSRSHAILQLDIRDKDDNKLGKMSFIDLAGSERGADVTDTDRQTRYEGAEINQSLLALKECIRSIDQESRHTPFRQSKLTHILKDSFVGNSKTCMIANISPSQSAGENTLNTLRYADRVKELKRDSVRSSTVGRAMNLLMNIPPSAPSIFHPSNVLSTSTPNRRGTVSRVQRSNPSSEIVIDPSETPIRGHNMPRRHRSGGSKHRSMQSQSEESVAQAHHERSPPPSNAEHRTSIVPRGSSLRSSNLATAAASQGSSIPPPDASPSESDHTDTDSCNVTNPANLNTQTLSGRPMPVARSSDTEFDFPTSDFNNMDEINDLNRPNPCPKQQKEETISTSHTHTPRERSLENDVGSACAAAAAASESMGATYDPSLRHPPVVKPVVYKSRDYTTDEPVAKRSISQTDSQKSDPSSVHSPQVSQHSPTFPKKSSFFEVLSSDSMDEEEMLAEGSSNSIGTSPAINNLAQPSSKPGEISSVPHARNLVIMNKNLMIPLPANSSDLTKFTQRPSLSQSERTKSNDMNKPSTKRHANKTESPHSEEPPSSRSTTATRRQSPTAKDRVSEVPSTSSVFEHPQNQQRSVHHHVSEQQSSSHTPSSPMSDHNTQHHSPKPHPPLELQSEARQRRRRASQSSIGDVSDDSTDSIRASLSDQGPAKNQRGTGEVRSGMRKERSDPMLALSMQRKKHTLPDAQNISKKLTRGNNPKAGLPQHLSGMKVVHTEMETSPNSRQPLSSDNSPRGNIQSHSELSVDHASIDSSSINSRIGCGDAVGVVSGDYRTHPSSGSADHGDEVSPKEKDTASKPREIVIHRLDGSKQWLPADFPGPNSKTETAVKNQGALVTEKLTSGAVFSPIHPQPVTIAPTRNTRESLLSSEMGGQAIPSSSSHAYISSSTSSSSSTLLQPTPVTASTMSWIGSSVDSSVQDGLSQAIMDARLHLVSAHEDQLATITSLCKYEMRLLLNAKKATGRRGFDEYLKKVNDILNQKVTAITALQDEIRRYHNSTSTNPSQTGI